MNNIILKICFLCGEALDGNSDVDHVVQRQFIKGQPKQRGLDYTGTIEVHESCNDKFGDKSSNLESICPKALQLLKLCFNEKYLFRQKKDDPKFKIIAFTEGDLKGFTKSDFDFFEFRDVRNLSYSEITNPDFYKYKAPLDPLKKPVNISLSVLAKSAAALLFKRYSFYPLEKWNIFATSFLGDPSIDYDLVLGETKPFYPGVKAWVKEYRNGDLFCTYKLDVFHVYFIFTKTEHLSNVDELKIIFPNNDIVFFRSKKLLDMVGYDWVINIY